MKREIITGPINDEMLNKHNTNYKSLFGVKESLQKQLDSLIIKDGLSNAEVVQARDGEPLLKDRLNKTDQQLAEKAQVEDVRRDTETHPIDVDEMNTRTKKLFTGGAVAVVDEDVVGKENLKNNAVTTDKIEFSKPGVNKFNGDFSKLTLYNDGSVKTLPTGMSAIMPVVGGRKYYIKASQTGGNVRRLAWHNGVISDGVITSSFVGDIPRYQNSELVAPSDAQYLIITLSYEVNPMPKVDVQVTEMDVPFFMGYDFIPNEHVTGFNPIKKTYFAQMFNSDILVEVDLNEKSVKVPDPTRIFYNGHINYISNTDETLFFGDNNSNFYMALVYDSLSSKVGLSYLRAALGDFVGDKIILAIIHPTKPKVWGVPKSDVHHVGKNKNTEDIEGIHFDYILDDLVGEYEHSGISEGISEDIEHLELYDVYDEEVANLPEYIKSEVYGVDPFGNELRVYTLSNDDSGFKDPSFPDNELYEKPFNKPKIIVSSGVHGDEKSAAWSLAQFVKDLCSNHENNPVLGFIYWNIELVIMPCVNPSGWDDNTRENRAQINLGRNLATTNAPEAIALRRFIDDNVDAIYHIDYHNIANGVTYGYTTDRDSSRLYVNSVRTLARKWKKEYNLPNSYTDFGAARYVFYNTPSEYSKSRGVDAFTLELGWKPFFANTKYDNICIQVGMDLFGNIVNNILKSKLK